MSTPQIILFHYAESIYSHRVLWYLALRALPFKSCIQPPYLPRPDLTNTLNINYRRIPIAAINGAIYCDSRLILATLESLSPDSSLKPPTAADAGLYKLFEAWSTDGGLFARAVQLLPYRRPGFLQDPAFIEDRAQMMGGRRFGAALMEKGRPEALAAMRQVFRVMESTFLANGRRWVLGTEGPTVADVEAVWVLQWLLVDPLLEGALGEVRGWEEEFPGVRAYVGRFMEAVEEGKARMGQMEEVGIGQVKDMLNMGERRDEGLAVDAKDPFKLEKGDMVDVWPTDSGFHNRDRGTLIGLSVDEIVIWNASGIRVHYPRWNFRIRKVNESLAKAVPTKKIAPMRLIYHPRSPFVRKVYMLAIEFGIERAITLHKVVVAPVPYPGWSDNNDEVAVFNPLAKLPTLIPEDLLEGIFDSRTMCDFLEARAESPKRQSLQEKHDRYWQLQTLHACCDGILDAFVLVTYELRIRTERGLKFDAWIDGQQLKISRALTRLETAASEGILPAPPVDGPASAAEVVVAVLLGNMDCTSRCWREENPALVRWFREWETRKSFRMTNPEAEHWGSSELKDMKGKI